MAEAKVIIKSENNISAGLNSAKQDLGGFGTYAQSVGEKIKSAFTFVAVIAAVKKLKDGLTDCFTAFNQADRAYKRLSLALSDSQGFDSVKKNIESLQQITLSSKDDIEAMVSELAALGKSSDDINKISEAAVHLSNVTGKDLNSSMTTLLNTYNGTTTQLNKLGIDTSNLTKEELAQGAAIDLIIDKYGELSKSMAADDSSQHIKNIKDNLSDMGQSIGQIVNVSFAPLLQNLDAFTNWAKGKVQEIADTATAFIQGFPEIFKHLMEAIGASLRNFWKTISSADGIYKFLTGIAEIANKRIQLIGKAVMNLSQLIIDVMSSALKGVGNLAMSWIVGITDSLGINISEVINSIGRWLLESPIGKFIDQVLSKAINGLKLIGTIIKNIPSIAKIAIEHLGDMIKEFFKALPEFLINVLKGIGNRILYGIHNIKNVFLQTVQDAINSIGNWIQGTWVGKAMKWMGLDLGGKLANIDFGIDTSKADSYKQASEGYFAAAGASMSAVKEIGAEMAQKINELLSPQIEQWQADSAQTIGQKMATWVAKSSDEYLDAAMANFKDIGSFFEEWGSTFLGDLSEDWESLKSTFTTVFEDAFGGDMSSFVEWFKEYIKTLKAQNASTQYPTMVTGNVPGGSGSGSGEDSSSSWSSSWTNDLKDGLEGIGEYFSNLKDTVLNDFISQMGEAGSLVNRLTQNMGTFGPVVGAIITALHYVVEGLSEVLGPVLEKFVKYGLEPLREIGRVIANILLPILDDIMPSIEQSAKFLIGIFDLLGKVIKPIVSFVSSFLTPILGTLVSLLQILEGPLKFIAKGLTAVGETLGWLGDWIRHIVATVVNWLASWIPWMSGMSDPGRPGNLGTRIQSSWDSIDSSFENSGVSDSTSTAVQNASYSGGTTVHLNVYNYGNIVGENGIDEFAITIRDKLYELNYYGR